MVESTNAVQITGEANGSVHPAIKVRKAAGADSVRRRLSSIFQRLIGEIEARTRPPLVSRACPMIHGSNCQSPRAQRCWRAPRPHSADSSKNSISVTSPARAKMPSKRS